MSAIKNAVQTPFPHILFALPGSLEADAKKILEAKGITVVEVKSLDAVRFAVKVPLVSDDDLLPLAARAIQHSEYTTKVFGGLVTEFLMKKAASST